MKDWGSIFIYNILMENCTVNKLCTFSYDRFRCFNYWPHVFVM